VGLWVGLRRLLGLGPGLGEGDGRRAGGCGWLVFLGIGDGSGGFGEWCVRGIWMHRHRQGEWCSSRFVLGGEGGDRLRRVDGVG
jgi:hypothetical protein